MAVERIDPLSALHGLREEREREPDEQWFENRKAARNGVSPEQHLAFAALVATLEEIQGERLKGPNRGLCLRFFGAYPETFRKLIDRARSDGRKPLALLVYMVRDPDERPLNGVDAPPTAERDFSAYDGGAPSEARRPRDLTQYDRA